MKPTKISLDVGDQIIGIVGMILFTMALLVGVMQWMDESSYSPYITLVKGVVIISSVLYMTDFRRGKKGVKQ